MQPPIRRLFDVIVLVVLCGSTASAADTKITYDEHVQPILRQKCFSCHNPDKRKGDLDMTNYTNLMQGGGSGEVIDPGDAESSYLFGLVTQADEPTMPPESPPIPDAMLDTIRKWIDGGALENAGSKARSDAKPKVDLAVTSAPTERPAVAPLPARVSLEPVMHTERTTAVTALATSPWAPLAAVAGERQVLLYDTRDRQLRGVLPFPEGVAHTLAFSRDGTLLLAGGGRGGALGRVVVWSTLTGDRLFEVGDELDAVLAADLRADHTEVALGGPPRIVRIYSIHDGQLVREIRKHTDWITAIAYSPDDVLLATADRNGGLFLWEANTGRSYATLKGHTKAVTGLSWRSDSNVLASASEDGTIRLWEMENGTQIKKFNAHGGGVTSVEFARDGRLVSCGRDRVAKLWDPNGKQLRAFPACADIALRVTFCDETDRVIVGDWTGTVKLFAAADAKVLGELATNPLSLADRLAAAQQELKQSESTFRPLAEVLAEAKREQASADAKLAELEKAEGPAGEELAAAEVAAQTAAQRLKAGEQAHQAAETRRKKLEGHTQQLAAAADQARKAADALPDDKEFHQAAVAVATAAEAFRSRLAAQQKAVEQAAADVEQARGAVAEAQKGMTAKKTRLEQIRQQKEAQATAVTAAKKATEAAKPAADAADAPHKLAE
ncbi:MAG: c-type cytochrome domain-containing protein, partial [Pirellulales bacterium]